MEAHIECDSCYELRVKRIKEEEEKTKISMENLVDFEPDDCTMVMEGYGKCQDYPCDDCVERKSYNQCMEN